MVLLRASPDTLLQGAGRGRLFYAPHAAGRRLLVALAARPAPLRARPRPLVPWRQSLAVSGNAAHNLALLLLGLPPGCLEVAASLRISTDAEARLCALACFHHRALYRSPDCWHPALGWQLGYGPPAWDQVLEAVELVALMATAPRASFRASLHQWPPAPHPLVIQAAGLCFNWWRG